MADVLSAAGDPAQAPEAKIRIQAAGQRQLLIRTPDRLRRTRGAGEITVCGQSVTLSFAPFWGLGRQSLSCNLDDIYNVTTDKDQIQFSVGGKGAELSRTFVFKVEAPEDLNLLTGRLPTFQQNKFAAAVKRNGEFDRLLSSATPHLWGTYALMAINILVFAVMLIKGGSGVLWSPPHSLVLGFGANFGPYTFGEGQWWRLLSCQFIHIGIILLLLSMFFLWWFGRIAERLYGSTVFILIYLCGGMIGAMPMLWANSIDIIAGSFDGTCAIYGASLGCLWRYRKEFPIKFSRKLLWFLFILIFLIFNSNIGSAGTNIICLLSGFAFGLMTASPPDGSKRKNTIINMLKISGLSAIIMTIAILQYNVSRNAPLQTFAKIYYQEEKSSMTAWRYLTQKENFDQMVKEKKFGEYINKNILPSFKKIIAQGKTINRDKLNIVEQCSFDRLMNFAVDKQEFFVKLRDDSGTDHGQLMETLANDISEKVSKLDKSP